MSKNKFRLVIRPKVMDNPNHHIWNNRGSYFCNITIEDGVKTYRIRKSLRTKDIVIARKKRDTIINNLKNEINVIDS